MIEARFQSFDTSSDRTATGPRLALLRTALSHARLDGFVIPRADRHQNENPPASEERLAWLTGFTGSAGVAIVLADRAAIFVDGRYTLQVRDEIDTTLFAVEHLVDNPPEKWIEASLPPGAKLGYDPWLHTADGAERLGKACAAARAELVAVESNPIDAVWTERPPTPQGAISMHDLRFAGEAASEKLGRVRAELAKLKADALAITDPAALAWTFNIRGRDVAHAPLPLAFALVNADSTAAIYVEPAKISDEVKRALAEIAQVKEPDAFTRDLTALGERGCTVALDQATAADALVRILTASGAKPRRSGDPIPAMKAIKNATEIAGMRAAQLRDGVAVARFLAWFEREARTGKLTEIEAAVALEGFRDESNLLKDISFPTIAGAGPNGAIVHYRVTRKSNRVIAPGELFLIDSGAQYEDGTTDITRTVCVGEPTAEMRDRFTRVLKGHIAIATAVFPDGITGAQLDPFARAALWSAGLDFDHGTGHGVGSYLSVHEGPARISKQGNVALRRGMILSNEPGYYKTGAYGIRIENLVLVVRAEAAGAEKPLNAFETLTLAPIDLRLVEPALLRADEVAWLDAYHSRVYEALAPLLDPPTHTWLHGATRAVSST